MGLMDQNWQQFRLHFPSSSYEALEIRFYIKIICFLMSPVTDH